MSGQTVAQVIAATTPALRDIAGESAAREVRRLVAAALQTPVDRLNARADDEVTRAELQLLHEFLQMRLSGRPLSQVLGTRAFWKAEFFVTEDVLDPRPDTETLVERALQTSFDHVLDLGTGSGCILSSLLMERLEARGVGVDISAPALAMAKRNLTQHKLETRAELIQGSWFDPVEGRFDLIVSNPPYVDASAYATLDPAVRKFEPEIALMPGETGLEAYEIIIPGAVDHLTPEGWLMVEIGHDQGPSVKKLFTSSGYREVAVGQDINGKDRIVVGKAP